jgi:hypothetical protein
VRFVRIVSKVPVFLSRSAWCISFLFLAALISAKACVAVGKGKGQYLHAGTALNIGGGQKRLSVTRHEHMPAGEEIQHPQLSNISQYLGS